MGSTRTPTVWIGGPAGSNYVAVTASATANVPGAWAEFGAVPFPTNRIKIIMEGDVSNTLFSALLNIGIGASGSQVNLIENIPVLWLTDNSGYMGISFEFDIPLLPTGTIIWANVQSTVASMAFRVSLGVTNIPHDGCSVIFALGTDTTTSSGTNLSTGAGAYGAWVSMGTLPIMCRRLLLNCSRAANSLMTVNVGIGASGSQQIISENITITFDPMPIRLDDSFPPGGYWLQAQATDVETINGMLTFS